MWRWWSPRIKYFLHVLLKVWLVEFNNRDLERSKDLEVGSGEMPSNDTDREHWYEFAEAGPVRRWVGSHLEMWFDNWWKACWLPNGFWIDLCCFIWYLQTCFLSFFPFLMGYFLLRWFPVYYRYFAWIKSLTHLMLTCFSLSEPKAQRD